MTDSTLVGRPLTLRPATADDEPFLGKVYAGTRAAELAAVSWTEEEKAAFLQMQFAAQAQYYREHYPDTSFDVILLDLDAEAVGRLYVARWTDEIRIVDIALLPEFCNRAIGTTLLRQLQAEAQDAGKPLRIHVERFNPALRLYERLGFRQIEDKGVYLFLEWQPAAP
jgi:ribosomal protein S18 acetylase RimI-like enzyme